MSSMPAVEPRRLGHPPVTYSKIKSGSSKAASSLHSTDGVPSALSQLSDMATRIPPTKLSHAPSLAFNHTSFAKPAKPPATLPTSSSSDSAKRSTAVASKQFLSVVGTPANPTHSSNHATSATPPSSASKNQNSVISRNPSSSTKSSSVEPVKSEADPTKQMQGPGRVDTVKIKQQIADALGDRGIEYWNAFRSFLSGKIQLKEFSGTAMEVLGEHVSLHNKLIMAILTNVYRNAPVPTGKPHEDFKPSEESVMARKRKKEEEQMAERDTKRSRMAKLIQSLDTPCRATILSAKNQPQPQKMLEIPFLPRSIPHEVTPDLQTKILSLQTCKMKGSLPTRDALRARMEVIGAMNGVAMREDCVSFMEQALSTYVKDILTGIQQRIRPPSHDFDHSAAVHEPLPVDSDSSANSGNAPESKIMTNSSSYSPMSFIQSRFSQNITIKNANSPSLNSSSLSNPSSYTPDTTDTKAKHRDRDFSTPITPSKFTPRSVSLTSSTAPVPAPNSLTTAPSTPSKHASKSNPPNVHHKPAPPKPIAVDDLVFVSRITPSLFMRSTEAVDTMERLIDAMDEYNEDVDPPHWKDISRGRDGV
ncbi:transcriptional regulator of RNA polII, SAGA, subunit-domain-containing protein [Zopfochytrium polystomum]|nr:transcriptional regulator of RNA polII, SAGA, subunit-domain-containing protein [Zopfochytrium polystomum]